MSGPAPTPLDRLRQAGQLTLIRSSWCVWEGSDWRKILPAQAGIRLALDGVAVIEGVILRPAKLPAGGGDG
jgi:hypothetical protein